MTRGERATRALLAAQEIAQERHRRLHNARVAEMEREARQRFAAETDRAITCAPLSTDDRAGFRATLTTIRNLRSTPR